ncbi:molybdopterin synthase subunit MoaD [Fluviicoccus keumensis]|uniref:Molybdopterin synthase sulfur carrier subunit n=1 Tax=Fluviicoccus keumensis TaxID=1435465 RepID=A0A4Q7Z5C0_9GAMM|nr:molybdopterin converting factor subunit 1 [Fluviicoccus keumensis]RZU45214.1 molybdopterin synthase subunit MoaD [Fluviicoccus keumensis]
MIKLCFFARFREKLGVAEESLPLEQPTTVSALMSQLAGRGGAWQEIFDCPRGIMVAINQDMATVDSLIHDGDEVALFPPVTGG